jgi:hypothetical protein
VPVLRGATRGEGVGAEQTQVVLHPPSNCSWTRPAAHPATGARITSLLECRTNDERRMIPAATLSGGGQIEQGHPWTERPLIASVLLLTHYKPFSSVLLLANFLTRALASERGLHAFFLTRLEVKGVALDFLNNVFLLHLALEAAQSVLEGLTLLQSDFRQTDTPPNPSRRTG